MRSLIFACAAAATAVLGCGAPTVDIPEGNDQITSEAPPSELPAPTVHAVPGSYPFTRLAIRGIAANAARVFVEGAGNPAVGSVQPLDGSFCVVVELTVSPAHYTLDVRSQSPDGRLSAVTQVETARSNDAPAPADAKLCDGTPIGG